MDEMQNNSGAGNAGKKNLLVLVAVIAVVIAGAALLYGSLSERFAPQEEILQAQEEEEAPVSNKPLSLDMTVYDWDGNPVQLFDMLQGKPVIVNFWASWCPPCRSEMPAFEKVWAELGDDVVFMMVDLVDGGRETVETGKAYIQENGFSFPVYFDSDQDAAYTYYVNSIPTTLFISAEGRTEGRAVGAVSEDTLREAVAILLEQAAGEAQSGENSPDDRGDV